MSVLLNRLFILTLIVSASFADAQNKLHSKVLSIKKDTSLNNHEKINKTLNLLATSDFSSNKENISDVYHQVGIYYEKLKKYKQAILEIQKAIDLRITLPKLDYKMDNSLFNMSQQYLRLKNEQEQILFLNKIIKRNNKNRFTYKAYNKLGLISKNNGDYFKALQFYEIIINSYDIYNDKNILFIAYKNAILTYGEIENLTDNDIKNVFKYTEQLKNSDLKNSYKMLYFNSLGKIHKYIGNYGNSIKYFKKSLYIALKLQRNERVATAYSNIAAIQSLNGNHILAKKHYNKALNTTNNLATIANVYYNQGFHLQTKNSLDKNEYYNRALLTILKLPNTTTLINYLPTLDNIKNSQYKIDILGYLIAKANNFLSAYTETKKTKYLEQSKNTLHLIDQLVSLIRFSSSNNDSKLFWIDKGVDSYMLAVKVCYLLKDTEAAFYFMEKNKSLLLLENLNATQEKVKLQLPDSILKREFNLRYAILTLESKRRKTPNNKTLTQLYLDKVNAYAHFLDTLKGQYPAYLNSKKEPEMLSLKETRFAHVANNTNYIEYILNDSLGYGIFCSKKSSVLFEIPNVPMLLRELDTLKNQINQPIIYKKDSKAYNKTAYSIFKKIIPFKNPIDSLSNKKLVIVPDYKLKNIPYEALIANPNNINSTHDYLINHNIEISYYQSASVFKQIEQKKRSAKKQLIGFAPTTFNYDFLPDLQASKMEMTSLKSLFTTTLLYKEQANKAAFVSSLNDYDIIHINTHAGITEDNEPWIAFADQKMQLSELYGMSNQANLVVLDACKSASGALLKGEGVMSLSRGFFYSGSKSVIASLWNVNEKSNNEILIAFYKNIKAGQTKSKALHNAKLKYLNTHQNSELSPYFWSSLILTGDAGIIEIQSSFSIYSIWGLLGVILLIGVFFLLIKRVKV